MQRPSAARTSRSPRVDHAPEVRLARSRCSVGQENRRRTRCCPPSFVTAIIPPLSKAIPLSFLFLWTTGTSDGKYMMFLCRPVLGTEYHQRPSGVVSFDRLVLPRSEPRYERKKKQKGLVEPGQCRAAKAKDFWLAHRLPRSRPLLAFPTVPARRVVWVGQPKWPSIATAKRKEISPGATNRSFAAQ